MWPTAGGSRCPPPLPVPSRRWLRSRPALRLALAPLPARLPLLRRPVPQQRQPRPAPLRRRVPRRQRLPRRHLRSVAQMPCYSAAPGLLAMRQGRLGHRLRALTLRIVPSAMSWRRPKPHAAAACVPPAAPRRTPPLRRPDRWSRQRRAAAALPRRTRAPPRASCAARAAARAALLMSAKRGRGV